ncbi:hypothetical protein LCM23_14630 [Cytobacillus kochii]|uniref:coiled-coil domain-containing protein n=1 Tax=Cytobacillus kochii TaxID=859143 RepID=UPI001CD73797|nr:hypothetical protein [Cytobacillus kochii]MCA1027333.1 hypothetical protein [Cytobacillus kochii]
METTASHISQQFLNKIQNKLTTDFFNHMDFSITSHGKNYMNPLTIIIKYEYNNEFKLRAEVPNPDKINLSYSPGYMLSSETYNDIKSHEFLSKISKWLKNIQNEMKENPLTRKVDEHDQLLKNMQEKINEMENDESVFTHAEKAVMERKLEDLNEKFNAFYEEQQEANSDLESEITKLNQDIQTLKTQLSLMTKKNWFKSFSVRLYNWYLHNPIMARRLAGATRELLPQEVREFVPEAALDQLIPIDSPSNEEDA